MYNYCREKTAMGKGGLTKWFKIGRRKLKPPRLIND
jgi:hypothetical protein